MTHQEDVPTISNGDVTVTTSSLSLTKQSDVLDEGGGDGAAMKTSAAAAVKTGWLASPGD